MSSKSLSVTGQVLRAISEYSTNTAGLQYGTIEQKKLYIGPDCPAFLGQC